MKFRITHDDKSYDVEEIEETEKNVDENVMPIEAHDDLTSDEIAALKQLAAAAPELLKLLSSQTQDDEPKQSDVVEVQKDDDIDCEDVDEDEDEKIIETHDSIKSAAGSVIAKKTTKDSSNDIDERALEIEEAYKNRYK